MASLKFKILAALLALLAVWLVWDNWPHAAPPSPAAATTPISGPLFDTNGLPAEAFGEGITTIVHVWATWCPLCMAEWPSLMQTLKTLPPQTRIVLVSADKSPPTAFYQKHQLQTNGSTLWLVDDPSQTLSIRLIGSLALPANFVVRGNPPRLIERRDGPLDWSSFLGALTPPLANN